MKKLTFYKEINRKLYEFKKFVKNYRNNFPKFIKKGKLFIFP